MSFLLYENNHPVYAGTINLSALDSTGVLTAPIVTESDILCENVYVARAVICDNCGDIEGDLTVTGNAEIDGWLDVDGNVSTGDLNVIGNINVSGWIDVIGNIDTADSINAANANINGDALINGNLTVGGWISATGNIDTTDCINAACANISQNVIIEGDLTVNGTFSGAGSNLRSTTLTLSAAQIIALNGTPVQIVAAPGAGKYLIFDSVVAVFDYVAPPFLLGSQIQLRYVGAGSATAVVIDDASVRGVVDYASLTDASSSVAINGYSNTAWQITTNGTAFTTGAGNIVITLFYKIV